MPWAAAKGAKLHRTNMTNVSKQTKLFELETNLPLQVRSVMKYLGWPDSVSSIHKEGNQPHVKCFYHQLNTVYACKIQCNKSLRQAHLQLLIYQHQWTNKHFFVHVTVLWHSVNIFKLRNTSGWIRNVFTPCNNKKNWKTGNRVFLQI